MAQTAGYDLLFLVGTGLLAIYHTAELVAHEHNQPYPGQMVSRMSMHVG